VPPRPSYTLALMAARKVRPHTRLMPVLGSRSRRDADNDLYDRGCDLVEATTAIRHATGHLDAARAAPALLGCLEAAMRELGAASATLEQTVVDSLGARASLADDPRTRQRTARMERGFTNLYSALADAEAAAAAARALVARSLAASAAERRVSTSRR
jgi:hypothetical protein